MNNDFTISYETMYDERSYRADSEVEDNEQEYDYIPPWEMEW